MGFTDVNTNSSLQTSTESGAYPANFDNKFSAVNTEILATDDRAYVAYPETVTVYPTTGWIFPR
jgi:hypothetical protein